MWPLLIDLWPSGPLVTVPHLPPWKMLIRLAHVNLGLGEPPNYKGEHHFFLPSINQHLKEIGKIRNPCQINTIGITEGQFLTRILGSEPKKLSRGEKKRAKIKLQVQDIKNPDDLLANLSEGKKAIAIDYPSLLNLSGNQSEISTKYETFELEYFTKADTWAIKSYEGIYWSP